MKQLICELCESNDFIKQDGLFVCQGCGMKYSLEEAKKLMGIAPLSNTQPSPAAEPAPSSASIPTPTPTPAPTPTPVFQTSATQLNNLIALAQNAFSSQNYYQAEDFCNQAIATDSTSYTAWTLKAKAIINIKPDGNTRLLEAYNCLEAAYSVSSDTDKETKAKELMELFASFFYDTIDFHINQFEDQRPTDHNLEAIVSTFELVKELLNKAGNSFAKSEDVELYTKKFETHLIFNALDIVKSAWNSTVFYNYYRKGFTEEYRPDVNTLKTFLSESDNLINLLEYAMGHFNNDIPAALRIELYDKIIQIHGAVCRSKSFKRMVSTTTNGYGAVTNRYEYWEEDQSPSADNIAGRRKKIVFYENEIRMEKDYFKDFIIPNQEKRTADYSEEQKRLSSEYLEKNPDAKNDALDKLATETKEEEENYLESLQNTNKEITAAQKTIEATAREYDQRIEVLKKEEKSLGGLFSGRERKTLLDRMSDLEAEKNRKINSLTDRISVLEKRIENLKNDHKDKVEELRLEKIAVEKNITTRAPIPLGVSLTVSLTQGSSIIPQVFMPATDLEAEGYFSDFLQAVARGKATLVYKYNENMLKFSWNDQYMISYVNETNPDFCLHSKPINNSKMIKIQMAKIIISDFLKGQLPTSYNESYVDWSTVTRS